MNRNNAPLKQIVGAALLDSLERPQQLLAARRSAPAKLAGLWEFPGGKVEAGEGCVPALQRELAEELGITVRMGQEIPGPHAQGWPLNESAAMRVWLASPVSGSPEPLEDHDRLLWVDVDRRADVLGLDWIPADLPIVSALLSVLAGGDQQGPGTAAGREAADAAGRSGGSG
ncbi:(deoxy)nucleoside triphosphate pyrophosphohydrolase [Arthrobacter castelli]|uniref:(deoxy)nucleoside triphosphate pyrophosphohydrolase n=1 Tax=Arthrobacter castelli TaxID=271431 RepID=UPI00316ABDE8